jgi:hypothetical protein
LRVINDPALPSALPLPQPLGHGRFKGITGGKPASIYSPIYDAPLLPVRSRPLLFHAKLSRQLRSAAGG